MENYVTGILPVKKYGQHSALNMFREYSMTNQKVLEEYTGFTENEVKALCKRFDMDFDGLRADIVKMLGGEHVTVNTRSFQNDMRNFKVKDDILTLLIHLGYLGYDSEKEEAFIPNKEITREFENALGCAIGQIKERQYTKALEGYAGEVLLVGVNYDKDDKNKPHHCKIEKMTLA